MKVIFIADVPNVARAGQTREVADGYARNFLFPRKLAVLASSQTAASVEAHLKKIMKQRAIEEAEMAELAKQIGGTELTLKAKVGEKEKLYGSVTGADIAESLSKNIGREIDKRKIDLAEPIRQVGVYDVTVRFTHEITAVVKVTVMSDAEGAPVPVQAEKVAVPAEEKKAEKKEKKEKKAKPPKEKAEKPAKEKKAKAEKASKAEKPEEAKPAEEEKPSEEDKPAEEAKKEKKTKSKAKKAADTAEPKKE